MKFVARLVVITFSMLLLFLFPFGSLLFLWVLELPKSTHSLPTDISKFGFGNMFVVRESKLSVGWLWNVCRCPNSSCRFKDKLKINVRVTENVPHANYTNKKKHGEQKEDTKKNKTSNKAIMYVRPFGQFWWTFAMKWTEQNRREWRKNHILKAWHNI